MLSWSTVIASFSFVFTGDGAGPRVELVLSSTHLSVCEPGQVLNDQAFWTVSSALLLVEYECDLKGLVAQGSVKRSS